MPRDRGVAWKNVDEGGMNNDPSVYHVSFLLIVGDRDEGGRRRENQRRDGPGSTVDSQAETGERKTEGM